MCKSVLKFEWFFFTFLFVKIAKNKFKLIIFELSFFNFFKWIFLYYICFALVNQNLSLKNNSYQVDKTLGNKNGLKVFILGFFTFKISHILRLLSHILLFSHHIKMTYFGSKNHIKF